MSQTVAKAAVAALAAGGAAIAGYLLYTRYTGNPIVCTGQGCETVQNSRYAELAGVPVALLGLLGYAALFAVALVRGETAHAAAVAITASALAFSAYLLVVQLTLIHALCVWCVASDCVLLTTLVVLVLLGNAATPGTPDS